MHENKFDLKLTNKNNKTPLHYLFQNKNISLEIIKYLHENKFDFYLKTKNKDSLLHDLFENKNISVEMLNFFKENNYDLTINNIYERSPLDILKNNESFVKRLSETFGKDVDLEEFLKEYSKMKKKNWNFFKK